MPDLRWRVLPVRRLGPAPSGRCGGSAVFFFCCKHQGWGQVQWGFADCGKLPRFVSQTFSLPKVADVHRSPRHGWQYVI